MASSEEAAAAAAAALISDDEASGEETEASGSETTEEVEFPNFDIEIPPDLAAELAEDEVETDVDEEEVAKLIEEQGQENEALIRRALAAERKAKHFEDLRVKEAKKNWADEAKKFFPLSEPFLDEITATSRRGYLRTAQNVHDRMKPIVEEKVLAPARAAIAKEKETVTTETKEEIKKAWGEPVKDDGTQPAPAPEDTQRPRRRKTLEDSIRSLIFTKES